MSAVNVDESALATLPKNNVSSDVYLVDFSSDTVQQAKYVSDIGSSLLHSSSRVFRFCHCFVYCYSG